MALTDTQIKDYYASQSKAVNPLSPADYEKTLNKNVISSANLENVAPTNFLTYSDTPVNIADIRPVDVSTKPTPETDKAQNLSDEIIKQREFLLGESADVSKEREKAGLVTLRSQESDLKDRLNTLINQSLAIPLQIQQESVGQGVSIGGAAPIEAARRRENAIDVLTTNSLLSSVQSSITKATEYADRAVAAKYDPIKERLAVLEKNLETIIASPNYTKEEKQTAADELARKNEQERKVAQEQANYENALAMANAAVSFYSDNPEANIAAQRALKLDPKSPTYNADIYNLLAKYQKDPTAALISLADLEYKKAQTEEAKQRIIKAKEEIKLLQSGGEGAQLYAGLTTPTATAVRAKVAKFSTEPIVENFSTIQEGYLFTQSLSDTTKNPADDQALIYSLAKALDPGSVVREGEYATAQKYAQSWTKAFGKGVEQAVLGNGFLSEEARKNIKDTIASRYKASTNSYKNTYSQYVSGINSLTGRNDGDRFLIDYTVSLPDITDKKSDTYVTDDGRVFILADDGLYYPEQ